MCYNFKVGLWEWDVHVNVTVPAVETPKLTVSIVLLNSHSWKVTETTFTFRFIRINFLLLFFSPLGHSKFRNY